MKEINHAAGACPCPDPIQRTHVNFIMHLFSGRQSYGNFWSKRRWAGQPSTPEFLCGLSTWFGGASVLILFYLILELWCWHHSVAKLGRLSWIFWSRQTRKHKGQDGKGCWCSLCMQLRWLLRSHCLGWLGYGSRFHRILRGALCHHPCSHPSFRKEMIQKEIWNFLDFCRMWTETASSPTMNWICAC